MKFKLLALITSKTPNSLDYKVLRIALAILFFAHAYSKPFGHGFDGLQAYFVNVGIPPFLAYVAFITEFIGAILLVFNLYILPVSIILGIQMLVATSVHFPNGWVFASPGGGWEYTAFISITLAVLGISTFRKKI